jgi:hypothetical protein
MTGGPGPCAALDNGARLAEDIERAALIALAKRRWRIERDYQRCPACGSMALGIS